MLNDWKIEISGEYGSINKNLIIYRESGHGRIEVLHQNGTISQHEVYAVVEPSLKLLPDMYDALVKYIFAKEKPINSTFLEGKVEAMGEHLADMRTLVFGKEKVSITGEESIRPKSDA